MRFDFTDPGFQNHVLGTWQHLRAGGLVGIKFDYPETAWIPQGGFEDKTFSTTNAYRKVFELCEAYSVYRRPLILHSGLTGNERRWKRRATFSSMTFMQDLPKTFPHMPIIFAHAGIAQYHEAISLAQRFDNLFLEISGQPSQHIREGIAAIGAERILFGTDWPFWSQQCALQAVREAVRNHPREEQRILFENAKKLVW